jgi:RHS repeat-associated protein
VNRGRMIAAARRYGPLVACLAVLALVAGGGSLVVLPHRAGPPRAGAVLAPGSQGSLAHHPWWDPRGWFGGSGVPKSRTIAAVGGPQTGRRLRQVASPPVRRVRELTAKRTADTRVYQLSDGRLQADVSAVPVNYRDTHGAWQPISTLVRPTAQAGFAFANTSNTFRSFFGTTAGRLVQLDAPGGGWLAVGLDGAHAGRPAVAGNTVTYRGVAPGADLSYQVTPTALKESVTLASASAASSFSYAIKVGGGLVPWQRRDGSIAFSRDGAGGPAVLVLPKPVMTDARRVASSPYGMAWSAKVSQSVAWDGSAGVLHVTVAADQGWLHSAARRFPVVIDPTISIAPTPTTAQNTFIEQDTPSTNYNSSYRLSVGTTSGGAVRSLLKFPLTAVPAGTQIDSADLRLYADQYFGSGGAQAIEADQATAAWDASTATWSNASNNVGTEGLNEVIVDDSDTAHTSASGSWPTASASAAQGGEYRYNQDTTAGDKFTWDPQLTEAGNYFVADHYVASTTAASNAPFTLTYSGGSQAYTVNQQSGSGGVWSVLGQKPFVAGTAGKVVLGDGPATGSVRVEADAARWRLWGAVTADPNHANVWHSFPVRNIVQSWLNGTANNGFVVRSSSEGTLNQGGPRYEASRFAYQGEIATYPQLVVTYGRPSVTINPITTIHATGAELSWTPYTDPTPGTNPGDDLAEYQVHRSVFQAFTPTASTLVAPVAAGTTSFTDTTNIPTPADSPDPYGNAFYYEVAVKTQDGQIIPSPVAEVRTPKAGLTIKVINASGDTTLSKAQPTTNEQQLSGQPWLGVGNDSSTYGVTRTVANFPSMSSAGIPSTATVTDAELKMWGWFNDGPGGVGSATYEAHALTQDFTPSTATWNSASSGTTWTTAGGAYSSTVAGSISGLTNDPDRQLWPVKSVVQGWITTPSSEHGLLVKLANETSPAERELFLNSSAAEPALRPELVVTYYDTTPQDTYYVPALPDPLTASSTFTVPVTLTNTTTSTWSTTDWVLSYHWLLPDGTEVSNSANQAQTPLSASMAPGAVATINATLKTPDTTGAGSTRTGYTLAWDLYNKTTGTWLSNGVIGGSAMSAGAGRLGAAAGGGSRSAGPARVGAPAALLASGNNNVPALPQGASVTQPTSNLLGLEKFYQYTGVNTGSGSALLNNADAGNVVWSYNAFSNPSPGFATFVRLAYNSMDTSNSSMGFGWSLQASTLMRLGTPLDFHPNPNPTTVTLTDGDGTGHLFTLNSSTGQWQSPPGVHEYLQQVGTCDPSGKTQNARAWLLTKPDRTQFFFDCQGYQSAVIDRNGNEADFTYSQRNSNNKPVKFLSYITDPSGRQALTLSYFQKGDNYSYIDANGNVATGTNLTDPQIIDQVKSITDISGRTINFLYTVQGLMAQMTDGDGSPLAKVFKFGYDMTQGNKNVKLVSVTDPRGHATGLAYYTAPQDPKFKWSLNTITDRRGGTTGFAYTQPGGGQIQTVVTDQNQHSSTYLIDPTGRPIKVTNAKQQVTQLAWDGDNNVTQLTEDNGAVTTWTYDPNTGYPLTMKDAQANHDGTAGTTYTYQTGLNGHIADLTAKLTPQQRLWTFGYDANGNLTSVTDPDGNATSTAGDYTTKYTYYPNGELNTATDADGNLTTYTNYDPNGYPQTITDALQNATTFTYDSRGAVLSVADPFHATTTQQYDVFGRPGQNVAPKDQGAGVYITTPAPVYDGNDNVTQATAPNGAVTTYTYDNNDEKIARFAPKDTSTGPTRETTYSYDPAGNLVSTTEPNGNQPSPPSSYTTTFGYDEINELTSKTDASSNITRYGYDDVGNRTSVTDPDTNLTKQNYDLNHRPTVTTDPANFTTSKHYDLDGLVTSTTDQNNNTKLSTLDPRGDVIQVKAPHDTSGGTTVYDTTQYAYDQVGNRTKVVTPRGVAAGVTTSCTMNCAFTQVTQYDADNRVKAQLSAYDPNDPVYNTPAETDYSYNAAGRLKTVTAPPSGGQTVPNVTKYGYFDTDWVRSSTDPFGITTSYDYNNLGQQTSRTIMAAGETTCPVGSTTADCRTQTWGYYPDGKLASRDDAGVPTGLATELVDNSDSQNTSSTGTWATATSGSGYQGFNYATHAAGSGTDAFTWKLDIPQDGNYTVYVKYPSVSGAATNASFKVNYSGGSATVAVNQTTNAGTWVSLGKWAFTQNGTGQKVTLSQNTGGTVVADAVKAVRDNTGTTNTAHHDFGYTYDPNGNLTRISDTSPGTAIGNYVITYNGLDQITKVEEQASGVTQHTTTYGYDPAGNLTSRGHDAAISAYEYNPRNLLSKETDKTSSSDPSPQMTTFTYGPLGNPAHEVKANGNTVDDTYFADGLLQHQIEAKPDGTTVAEHTYTYTPDGDKSQDVEKLMSADNNGTYLTHTLAYSYDPRDRVTQVTKDGTVTEKYTHDANDNVTAQTIGGTTTTFGFDRNRLVTATTNGSVSDYNYDPFGRLDTVTAAATGQVVQSNTYDGFDHITAHQQLNATGGLDTTTYTYDPLDRKTSQTAAGKTTSYAYLGLSSDLTTESALGQVTKSYEYTPGGMRLSQTTHNTDGTSSNGYYTYNDHSDVEAVTDSNGNTKSTYGYTAYGQDDKAQFTGADKTNPQQGNQPFNAYRFNAMRWDSSTNQYDMGFRTYDSGLNQFLSRDMYNGALGDMNLDTDPFTGNRYTFGGGNPISNIELDGHTQCDAGYCPTLRQTEQVTQAAARYGAGCPATEPGCPGYHAPSLGSGCGLFMPHCTNPCVQHPSMCLPLGTQLNNGTQSGPGNNRTWNMFGQNCPLGIAMFICPSLATSGEGEQSGQAAGGSEEQIPLFGRLISEVFNALKAAKSQRDIFALLKEYRQMREAAAAVRLDLGNDTYIGVNFRAGVGPVSNHPEISGTVEGFVKHAEGDAFARAIASGIDYSGESGTLYVTKAEGVGPCQFVCQRSFDAVARQMGLSKLTVYTPEGIFGSWDPEAGWVLAKP